MGVVELGTGVYFHEILSQKFWPIMGDKFKNFPEVMKDVLQLPGVKLFTPEKVSTTLLFRVHESALVEDLLTWDYGEGALYSAGGCVEAAQKVYEGELRNAFVFSAAAGHHAGTYSAWGGTYVSCTGPAIVNLQQKYDVIRCAIVDTDSHHGDGTRQIFMGARNVLHVCFCDLQVEEDMATKICVRVGKNMTDEEYLEKVRKEFFPRARKFRPEIIFHLLGHDTHKDDYGSRGLSSEHFITLVRELKELAEEICAGKLVVITMGGALPEVSDYIHPRIIKVLAQ